MYKITLFSDELLIHTYKKALELNLDTYILNELNNEITKRNLNLEEL